MIWLLKEGYMLSIILYKFLVSFMRKWKFDLVGSNTEFEENEKMHDISI